MNATVLHLPTLDAPRTGLNLDADELVEASGGYVRPHDQLISLHDRGFCRAYRSKTSGKVVLERAHYEAVTRGQFGQVPANDGAAAARQPAMPDRAGFRARFGGAGKAKA